MKNNFLMLMMSLAFAFGHAQAKIDFRDGSLADAFKEAKARKKSVFFMGYATWCPHCNKMKSEVFKDTAVINFYNRNFVCVWQDMEKPEAAKIKSAYHVNSYPALLYFNAGGDLIYSIFAELNAARFIEEGKKALTETEQLPFQKAQFEAEPSDAAKALAYISALRRSHFDTEAATQRYFSFYKPDNLATEQNWRIFANGERDITSNEFVYVLANRATFEKVSSAKRVDKKIVNIIQEWLQPSVDAVDTTGYGKRRAQVAGLHLRKADSLAYLADLKIFEAAKSWKRYGQAAMSAKEFSWGNVRDLRDIARNHMANIDDAKMLANAIACAERSEALAPNFETRVIIARLYLKTGDKANAKSWAGKALEMAKSSGFDTKQADAVLEELKS